MQRSPLRLLVFAIFCSVLAAVAWFGARWVEKLPARMVAASEHLLQERALRLREEFFQLAHFQPKVRINQRVISETTSEITEIALLEKEIEVENEFVHTWAGSTKTIRLRGRYRVKAGFRLLDQFQIDVSRGHTEIEMPPATILSIEEQNFQVETLEGGFWNPVSAGDLEQAEARLKEIARAKSAALPAQVDATFRERLRRVLGEKVELTQAKP